MSSRLEVQNNYFLQSYSGSVARMLRLLPELSRPASAGRSPLLEDPEDSLEDKRARVGDALLLTLVRRLEFLNTAENRYSALFNLMVTDWLLRLNKAAIKEVLSVDVDKMMEAQGELPACVAPSIRVFDGWSTSQAATPDEARDEVRLAVAA
jgi:hypothetical protein